MLRKPNFIYANFCLFCLLVTMHWADVISASIISEEKTSTEQELTSAEQTQINAQPDRNSNSKLNNILDTNEYDLSDYEDDLDADVLEQQRRADHDWDVLIFTQQWPVTTCYHWREEDKDHKCSLPAKKEYWTIHGVWPTKLGHLGPSFCNKSANFNLDQLHAIMERLNQYWPDIDGESQFDWLWKHEWLKHGTCALTLEDLNNELKYFSQALIWRDKYFITNILGAAGIHPDSNNTVVALHTAIVQALGKNPSIHCLYDNKNDISYLAEIRICFDKSLQLTDCDGVKRGDAVSIAYPGGNVITNCHISQPVHYPSLVPTLQGGKQANKWKFPVVNVYKLLQFIMWFTL